MKFSKTHIDGVVMIDSDESLDQRGGFFRTFCSDEFERNGLPGRFVQSSVSRNTLRGTLRGMHFQRDPRAEGKLVRCIRGRAFDVALDLRRSSPTFKRWFAVELAGAGTRAIFVPAGVAHGFQTLEDDTEIFYQMTEPYVPELAGGVRFDDPAFAISWPRAVSVISERDKSFADFD
ncbi:dTDP-4-dehydrorhamnose 3,5-epimerase [Bradyrhizobium lablabi]|uniref:dTDP-4-dehydrorhamnose 3,5-epimerase n=1 Tax=Bradyrhizobium lablabi TaxID=722472 RepID=A0A1M7BEC1_9BRAD|nr:dTDP-4-dehydrorhamnose 3,5-epimerase [Bradyrhizobium lablabi]SHL53360.1 dTDP-4-dehydrorhamnose 3,5-epimerase [Bradyrhizobium lablabi]